MKKILVGIFLMPLIIGGISIANASDTSCWSEYGGTVPASTYASGIVYGCDHTSVPGKSIPIITIYGENKNGSGVGITIKAMNEGTGEVKIGSLNDTGAYGSVYQRGNNYPFPNLEEGAPVNTGNACVSATGYGPGTASGYYSSNTRIIHHDGKYHFYWDCSNNRNLWGGGSDFDNLGIGHIYGFNTGDFIVKNAEDRQAMCPDGYHIPSLGERKALKYLWGKNYNIKQQTNLFSEALNTSLSTYFYENLEGSGNTFSEDLLMPFVQCYWSSSTYFYENGYSNYVYSHCFEVHKNRLHERKDYRQKGHAVRCFKNSYVPLPKTLNLVFMSEDEKVGTGEVTENMTGVVPEKAKNVMKTGYELLGWIRSGATTTEIFEFETTPISGDWADESGNVYFIAQWTGIKYSVAFTGMDVKGTMENIEFTYGITGALTPNAFTKNGYTFSGWTDSEGNKYTDGQEVNNLTTTGGEVITLTAEWTKNKTSGGSSGGGGSMRKDNCPNGDLSPSYYDGTCEGANVSSGTDVKDLEGDTQDSSDKSSEGQTELEQAYQFAFKNSITTMDTIDKANMDGYIKRGHLAKMVVNYVTNVLGKEIPSDIPASCLSFNDESTVRESEEIKDYAIKSCALGLMGINMKNNEFLPNDYVTRAEFGTVLSRVLWGDKYNLVGSKEKPRYSAHLNALKEEGIMKMIDNPKMLEKRGYVMIMLMRSANN